MKKKSIIIMNLLIILAIISININVYAVSIDSSSFKNSIKSVNSYMESNINYNNSDYLDTILDSNGNVPAYTSYPNKVNSRGISTLKAYNGKIFMGLGDWDANTGPVKILYYDTKDNKIKSSGTIADEAVENFTIIDDNLYTTGCDPKSTWGYGSYYKYNDKDNKWEQHENQNGWIHVFNITKFNNKIFMCGSTQKDHSPIQASNDNGKTFENISICKYSKQIPIDENTRCYNLYSFNNNLYGFFWSYNEQTKTNSKYDGIYQYDKTSNQFNYIAEIPSTYLPQTSAVYRFSKSSVFNGNFVFVAGYNLYSTTDFKTFNKLSFPAPIITAPTPISYVLNPYVYQNSLVIDDTLYVLAYKNNADAKENRKFKVQIHTTKDLKKFQLFYEFETNTPPFSFEYYDKSFYIGTYLGSSNKTDSKTNRKFI